MMQYRFLIGMWLLFPNQEVTITIGGVLARKGLQGNFWRFVVLQLVVLKMYFGLAYYFNFTRQHFGVNISFTFYHYIFNITFNIRLILLINYNLHKLQFRQSSPVSCTDVLNIILEHNHLYFSRNL